MKCNTKLDKINVNLTFPPPPMLRYIIAPGSADWICRPSLVRWCPWWWGCCCCWGVWGMSGTCWSRAASRSDLSCLVSSLARIVWREAATRRNILIMFLLITSGFPPWSPVLCPAYRLLTNTVMSLPVPNNARYDYEYRLQNIFSGLNRTFQPQCIGRYKFFRKS